MIARSWQKMFSDDELRGKSSQARVPGLVGVVQSPWLTILIVCLVLAVYRAPALSQITLDDLVIRAFDITVAIAPVPLRYDFEGGQLRFTSRGRLRGTTTAMVEVTSPSPVAIARFSLDSDVTLKSVTAVGHNVASKRQRDTLLLTFTPPLAPGAKVPVTFAYEGQPLYIFDEFVLVSEGSLYPVLISPFGDFSANLGRVKLKLTAPGGYSIAGTGKLVAKEGGVLTWDSEVPVPWVAVAGGRKHAVREKTLHSVTMQFYVPPGEDRNLDKLADFAGRSVGFFSHLLYPFPYSELRAVSLFAPGASGLGYPGLLMIDARAFRNTFPGDLNRDSFLFHLIAHELAHGYVPSQTVPKGIGFIWLSEGFAEYLSLMAVEALLGPDAFQRELQEERDNYAFVAATATTEPSIAAITFANYHGPATWVIYAKGSLVLHMLRGVLGDALFKKGLAAYFSTFRGRAARVADFQATMERVSGQSLGWFFDEWINEKVLPDYTITRVTSLPTPDGAFQTTATVRNLGTGQMPVEVGFVMDGGDVQIQRVEIPSRGEVTVTATTPKAVKQVEVDPKKWVIQKDYTNDVAPVR